MKKTILFLLTLTTFLSAETLHDAMFGASYIIKKDGSIQKNIVIDSKECAYLGEAKFNQYTGNTEIKLLEKICKDGRKNVKGSIISAIDKKNGLPGNNIEAGTKVIIKEL